VIERADPKDGCTDNNVHYGQSIRITTNGNLMNRPLYLSSVPISPISYARFSRNQEVCVINQKVYSTVWKIVSANGNPKDRLGEVIRADEPLIFEH